MVELWMAKLKQPCKNRGIEIVNNHDDTVSINGILFDRLSDCEKHLESVERID